MSTAFCLREGENAQQIVWGGGGEEGEEKEAEKRRKEEREGITLKDSMALATLMSFTCHLLTTLDSKIIHQKLPLYPSAWRGAHLSMTPVSSAAALETFIKTPILSGAKKKSGRTSLNINIIKNIRRRASRVA